MNNARLAAVRTWSVRLLAAELLVLIATGVALYVWYRPQAGTAWDAPGLRVDRGIEAMFVVRDVHAVTTIVFLLTASVAAVAHLLAGTRGRAAASAGIVLLGAAAGFTGLLLPWDQLALWAVTIGEDFSGYRWLSGADSVRFVIIDDSQVGLATLRRWFVVHVGLTIVAAVVLALLLRRARRERR